MKVYLCKEFDELFVLEAEDMNDAINGASIWGGRVIRELDPSEVVDGVYKGCE